MHLVRFVIAVVAAGSSVSFAVAAELRDDQYGYVITVPNLGKPPAGQNITRFITHGPAEEGFSPNINLQVQNVKLTRDEFIAMSDKQVVEVKMKKNDMKVFEVDGLPAVLYDFEWTLQGIQLRILSLAVIRSDDVIVVTSTVKAADFEKHQAEIRNALNSLKFPK